MKVEVVVFATLRRYLPELKLGETEKLDIRPGTKIVEIARMLKLPEDEVKVIMRNNRHSEWDDEVFESDRIAFLPAVAGG